MTICLRFSEPSSYAGIGALLALAGFNFSDSDLGQLAQFLAAGCALAALLLKERGMIKVLALAVLAATTLGACTGPTAPSPATIQTDAAAILTTTQQAMCEAQSAANLASAVAAASGDASAGASTAGIGCTWRSAGGGLIRALVAVILLSLGGCAGLLAAGSPQPCRAGAANTTIQTACGAYEKGPRRRQRGGRHRAGVLAAAGKVGVIEEYGDAACANPPSGSALSTAIWLGTLVGQIATLTSVTAAT